MTAPPDPCTVLLTAITRALALPYPATRGDELAYFTLRSKRASLVLCACETATRPSGDGLDLLAAAALLEGALEGLPPDGYQHSGLPS